jgi:hypothetical protein
VAARRRRWDVRLLWYVSGVLISRTPQANELRQILLREFAGKELAFDDIREQTWKLPFVEKHYREVIKNLRAEGIVAVIPVSSKKSGLKERDLVRFPKNSQSSGSEKQP